MTDAEPVRIADGDSGWIYINRVTGARGRARIRLSRDPRGTRRDPTFGPKAALELQRHLNDFIYQAGGTPP